MRVPSVSRLQQRTVFAWLVPLLSCALIMLVACIACSIGDKNLQLLERGTPQARLSTAPAKGPETWLEDIGPTLIDVRLLDGNAAFAVNGATVDNEDELRAILDTLSQIEKRSLVIFRTDPDVPLEQAMALIQIVRDAGLQNIQLASPSIPSH